MWMSRIGRITADAAPLGLKWHDSVGWLDGGGLAADSHTNLRHRPGYPGGHGAES